MVGAADPIQFGAPRPRVRSAEVLLSIVQAALDSDIRDACKKEKVCSKSACKAMQASALSNMLSSFGPVLAQISIPATSVLDSSPRLAAATKTQSAIASGTHLQGEHRIVRCLRPTNPH